VERWIDDAVEQLMGMRYSCALDVAEEYPDGITERSVGAVLGVSEKAAHADLRRATERLRDRMADRTLG
jgi:DNA-directed RNA polymerase specialized sigma24 family protein